MIKLFILPIVMTILAIGILIEAMSMNPAFDIEQATIINVQNDSEWGFIGEDKRTLIKFSDGVREFIPGAMGEPGELIGVGRRSGTISLFGIFADRSYFSKQNRSNK